MNFTAEEIKQFDLYLFKASCYEILAIILLGALVLLFILIFLFLPDKYLTKKRNVDLYEKPKKSRYRNGKKISHQELTAERLHERKKKEDKEQNFSHLRGNISTMPRYFPDIRSKSSDQ